VWGSTRQEGKGVFPVAMRDRGIAASASTRLARPQTWSACATQVLAALVLLVTIVFSDADADLVLGAEAPPALQRANSFFDDFMDESALPEHRETARGDHESIALVKDTPSGKLVPDERGLAFLRSPALASTPLRIIGVVGQARTGKSFFMNSLVGKSGTFAVSSGDEGFTKGLWLHHLEDGGVKAGMKADSYGMDESTGSSGREHGVATLLIDSEGLGAPGASKVYDTKLVALTTMLSSVVFYNNMRKVNKMDVEFLGDVVLFDDIFRSMTDHPLLASSIVWLVQSYSSIDQCSDYPSRFLRKLDDGGNEELLMHDRVIDYVLTRSRDKTIFCLPYPKTNPYTPEASLHLLNYEELDAAYSNQMRRVRDFISSVAPKQGLNSATMTGDELASVVERLVPALNDIETAAKTLIALRAEAARTNATRYASSSLEGAVSELRGCEAMPTSLSELTQVVSEGMSRLKRGPKCLGEDPQPRVGGGVDLSASIT
jgi:hypothetical protein